MENYTKEEEDEELDSEIVIEGIKDDAIIMRVKFGSKMKNLMQFAEKRLNEGTVRQIVWEGSGVAVQKTISCAEILKKKHGQLHQITKIAHKTIIETWKPKLDGLDKLRVKREIPTIAILLSKDSLESIPGHQAPGDTQGLFEKNEDSRPKRRLTGKGDARRSGKKPMLKDDDESLLSNTLKQKEYEKQMKMDKKKKKAEAKRNRVEPDSAAVKGNNKPDPDGTTSVVKTISVDVEMTSDDATPSVVKTTSDYVEMASNDASKPREIEIELPSTADK